MRVLIACECSGQVRSAFRALGHDAWSCDLKPAEDNSPYHVQGDVLEIIGLGWDAMVSHAVCKYLANSGAKHLYVDGKKENGRYEPRWEAMEKGAAFYAKLWDADIPIVVAENPIWHKAATEAVHRHCKKPHPVKRQFVQPWMFGHTEVKATGLAIRGAGPIEPTDDVKTETFALDYKDRAKVHYASPGPERETNRSRTLPGLAWALAWQIGGDIRTRSAFA